MDDALVIFTHNRCYLEEIRKIFENPNLHLPLSRPIGSVQYFSFGVIVVKFDFYVVVLLEMNIK